MRPMRSVSSKKSLPRRSNSSSTFSTSARRKRKSRRQVLAGTARAGASMLLDRLEVVAQQLAAAPPSRSRCCSSRCGRRPAGSAASAAPAPPRRACPRDVVLERRRSRSSASACGVARRLRAQGLARGDGEDLGRDARAACGAFSVTNWTTARDVGLGLEDVDLVERDHDLLAPVADRSRRNARSLSVNGRSAEVTNSTRSERGTNSRVSASCSRRTALVPGVSTMLISRSSSTGAVITSRPVGRGLAARPLGP